MLLNKKTIDEYNSQGVVLLKKVINNDWIKILKQGIKKYFINPNIEKVIDDTIKKKIIIKGCFTSRSTNKPAVAMIMHPIIKDLVAAAPTKPRIISKLDNGADNIS